MTGGHMDVIAGDTVSIGSLQSFASLTGTDAGRGERLDVSSVRCSLIGLRASVLVAYHQVLTLIRVSATLSHCVRSLSSPYLSDL